jgi:hypothetical protein
MTLQQKMCVNCKNRNSCLGCSRSECYCKESCFTCFQYQNITTGCFFSDYPNSMFDFRTRYLCLECNSCWKDKYDKYAKYISQLLSNDIINELFSSSEATELINLKKNIYFESRCKCGSIPIKIGEKFRPPKKKDKQAWTKIKNMTDEEKKNLFSSYCPYYATRTKPSLKNFRDKNIITDSDALKNKYDIISIKEKLRKKNFFGL